MFINKITAEANRKKSLGRVGSPLNSISMETVSDNQYSERPLKHNQHDLCFKGLSSSPKKVFEVVEAIKQNYGETAAKEIHKMITELGENPNSGVSIDKEGNLSVSYSKREEIKHTFWYPTIKMPLDISISVLTRLKKTPILKNSSLIDSLYHSEVLETRRKEIEHFSNLTSIQHLTEVLSSSDKKKFNRIFPEGLKRLNEKVSNYTTRSERTLTRIVTGIVPAFFLANDAYNLSIYMNDDKVAAKKEKKRRFVQEVARIAVTAASTFAILSLFAKKSNSNPEAATVIIAAATLGSEIVGRMMTGVPFYPLGENGAKKYAKLRNQKTQETEPILETKDQDDEKIDLEENKKSDKKSSKMDFAMKAILTMIAFGFAKDMLTSKIKFTRELTKRLNNSYKSLFEEDVTITREQLNEQLKKLRQNGFNQFADNYEKYIKNIIEKGNLTGKEKSIIKNHIDKKIAEKTPGTFVINEKKYKEKVKAIREQYKDSINQKEVMRELGIKPRTDEKIYLHTRTNKWKDILVNEVLALPIKFIETVLAMPYDYIIKPLYAIPLKYITKDIQQAKKVSEEDAIKFINKYLNKNIDEPDFKENLSQKIMESFDIVNKSNFSNADLSGAAKIAVSTVTSAFLVTDNYNMVMIDSKGDDQKLAGQKAKERTIQRIARIAYGACIIKLFNGIFRTQYNGSLVGAQTVNAGNALTVESLERLSVGLPLHEATRDEIIEKDNKNLEADGLIGKYFRFMSKLTGKKSIQQQQKTKPSDK